MQLHYVDPPQPPVIIQARGEAEDATAPDADDAELGGES
jgi:hypothetical protein